MWMSWGRVMRGCSAFQASRASRGKEVSKDCAVSPGSGMLWARAPAGMVTGAAPFSSV